MVHRELYRKHCNGILLKCLEAHDLEKVLHDLHEGLAGGHFTGNTIAHKVMQVGSY